MTESRGCRRVVIDGCDVTSWESFHDVFAREFRFFSGYGRNMNAWIDCMSSLDEVDGVTDFGLADGEGVALELHNFEEFSRLSGEIASALLECTAFVNRRYAEWGSGTRIAIVPM